MTGYLADRQLAPSSLVLAGLAVLLVTFPLLGPAPCLPLQPNLALTTACLLTQVDRKITISGGMTEACSNMYLPSGRGLGAGGGGDLQLVSALHPGSHRSPGDSVHLLPGVGTLDISLRPRQLCGSLAGGGHLRAGVFRYRMLSSAI